MTRPEPHSPAGEPAQSGVRVGQAPALEPQYLIAALSQEVARLNDNRIYLIALVEQLSARVAELQVAARTD